MAGFVSDAFDPKVSLDEDEAAPAGDADDGADESEDEDGAAAADGGDEPAAEEAEGEAPAAKADKTAPKGKAGTKGKAEVVPRDTFVKALDDERGKARTAREAAAYWRGIAEGRMAAPGGAAGAGAGAPAAEDEQIDDNAFLLNPGKAVQDAVSKHAERIVAAREQASWQRRAKRSAAKAMQKYGDEYLQREHEFKALADSRPSLYEELRDEVNPAEWLYQYVEEHRASSGAGDKVKELEAKVAQLEKRLSGETDDDEGDDEDAPAPPAKLRPKHRTIARVRGAGPKAVQAIPSDSEVFQEAFKRTY